MLNWIVLVEGRDKWWPVCCCPPPPPLPHHHHHLANIELGCLLTRSTLTYLEVSLMVFPGTFCLLVCSFLLSLVICLETFYLYVVVNFFSSPVFCTELGLYLVPLQTLCLYNLCKCVLLFFTYVSSLLLLFFLCLLLQWSDFHYLIIKLEGLVYCLILFWFSLKFCVVWYIVYNASYFQIVIQFVISVHFFFIRYQIS